MNSKTNRVTFVEIVLIKQHYVAVHTTDCHNDNYFNTLYLLMLPIKYVSIISVLINRQSVSIISLCNKMNIGGMVDVINKQQQSDKCM